MTRLLLLLSCLLSVAACGVQGDLYLPTDDGTRITSPEEDRWREENDELLEDGV